MRFEVFNSLEEVAERISYLEDGKTDKMRWTNESGIWTLEDISVNDLLYKSEGYEEYVLDCCTNDILDISYEQILFKYEGEDI